MHCTPNLPPFPDFEKKSSFFYKKKQLLFETAPNFVHFEEILLLQLNSTAKFAITW